MFTEHYPEHLSVQRGRKTQGKIKEQFRVLILDLYVSWLEDPDQYLGVHLGKNAYKSNSRYNSLFISFKLVGLIHQCHAMDWLDWVTFSYGGSKRQKNRTTRIRASDHLIELFKSHCLSLDQFSFLPDRECILLTNNDPHPDDVVVRSLGRFLIDYVDTEQTKLMRDELMAYNHLLSKTHIDIASLDEPIVTRLITKGPYAGQMQRIRIGQHNKFVRRVFSRGQWDLHGRFYGGFWQQISEDLRKDIFINGEPTVEIDFKALHVSLLYAIKLHEVWPYSKDPFALQRLVDFAPDASTQRKWVKLLVLQCLNASNRKAAFAAFRNESDTGSLAKRLTNEQLAILLDVFVNEHPRLEEFLLADVGVELMNYDSRLMAHIIRQCTKQNIPILTIHDSCLCRRSDFAEVRTIMTIASIREVGYDLFVEQDGIEVDHMEGYGHVLNERAIHKLPKVVPTEGYQHRLDRWLILNEYELKRTTRGRGLMSTPVPRLGVS
jgi:hypothetical protein